MKIQQGDVVLKRVSDDEWNDTILGKNSYFAPKPKESTSEDVKCILALGEHTGHHHRFESSKMGDFIATSYGNRTTASYEPKYIEVKYKDGKSSNVNSKLPKIYHEEHNPISVPPGVYKIDIVQEYDHLMDDTRRVVD